MGKLYEEVSEEVEPMHAALSGPCGPVSDRVHAMQQLLTDGCPHDPALWLSHGMYEYLQSYIRQTQRDTWTLLPSPYSFLMADVFTARDTAEESPRKEFVQQSAAGYHAWYL